MYGNVDSIKISQSKLINEIIIYKHYLKYKPELRTKYISPFVDERTPSFTVYIYNNTIRFKCFSSGIEGDCFVLISKLFNISYSEAQIRAVEDILENGRYSELDVKKRETTHEKKQSIIEVVVRSFTEEDLAYWDKFGITKSDLEYFDIKSCREVWVNDKLWYKHEDEVCFRYRLGNKYKIYRPNAVKKYKWISNTTIKHVQGFKYLPKKAELLVITKSLKDVMVLWKHLGVNSVAFNSESTLINKDTVEYFKSRFNNVIILYDNDEAGIRYSIKQSESTGFDYVLVPPKSNCKDPSELYENYGEGIFKRVIKKLLNIKN